MAQTCAVEKKSSANCACTGSNRKSAPQRAAARPGNQILLQRASDVRAVQLERQSGENGEAMGKEPTLDELQRYRCNQRDADPQKPQTQPFTDREKRRVQSALTTAQSTTSQAYGKLANRDPYHLKIAERAFHTQVDFATLDRGVSKIKAKLDAVDVDKNTVMGTCADSVCADDSIAYTPMPLTTVIVCPFFFLLGPVAQAVTLIHEAGHMAVLDPNWKPGNEVYCYGDETMDCTDICPVKGQNLLENVDAWARFVYCVSLS